MEKAFYSKIKGTWTFRAFVASVSIIGIYSLFLYVNRKTPSPPSDIIERLKESVEIIRDSRGVPHIFGPKDSSVAFGLAYAHAQDDYKTIYLSILAARGELSRYELSKLAIGNDYLVGWLELPLDSKINYPNLSSKVREIFEAYAEGLNYFAYKHPSRIVEPYFRISGEDVARGFSHKLAILSGVAEVFASLVTGGDGDVDELSGLEEMGSNAHAISGRHFKDGASRLNINSHQPWEGPVAWYEAHIHSEEGWQVGGGLFPGSPFILHGFNEKIGWAHTVNKPDLVDVFELKTTTDQKRFQMNEQWELFEELSIPFRIGIGNFTVPWELHGKKTRFGPVICNEQKCSFVRYAGMGRFLFAAEQWYRMNKAQNLTEFKKAMSMQVIPKFNTVFADKNDIYYVYNALLPKRVEGLDWRKPVLATSSSLIWDTYLPFSQLPTVENPKSGFLQSCNSSPFETTLGPGNPRIQNYAPELGIETYMPNRSMRSLEIMRQKDSFWTSKDFISLKYDTTYDERSPMYVHFIHQLQTHGDHSKRLANVIKRLKGWNGVVGMDSLEATWAILSFQKIWDSVSQRKRSKIRPLDALSSVLEELEERFSTINIPWSDINRLRRGEMDLPLVGGPDLLHTIIGKKDGDGRLKAWIGDSYIALVSFKEEGPEVLTGHHYGSSQDETSKFYNNQSRAFSDKKLFKLVRRKKELLEKGFKPFSP